MYNMTMDKTKETKGTVVFTERVDDEQRPHTFYILKDTWRDLTSPDAIDVQISVSSFNLTEEE